MPGCWWGTDPPPPYSPPRVEMMVPDFATQYDSGADLAAYGLYSPAPILAVEWSSDSAHLGRADAWNALRSSVRLSRDGEPVPGEVREDWFDVTGTLASSSGRYGYVFSFVPDEPLQPGGWYTFSADFTAWQDAGDAVTFSAFTTHRGGRTLARFRIDTHPCWTRTLIPHGRSWPPDPTGAIEIQGILSEPTADWGTTSIEARYDGVVQDCSVAFGDGGFLLTCPTPPFDTDVELRLASDTIVDAAGASPAVQTFRMPATATSDYWLYELVLPDFAADDGP